MQTTIYLLISAFLFLGCCYLGFKLIEYIRSERSKRFKTPTAHFLSDLYKLKIKWSDLGEFGFVVTIDEAIRFYGNTTLIPKAGGPSMPFTNDALSTDLQLKNLRKEEFKEVIEEFIG